MATEEAERAGYGPDFLQLTSGHTQIQTVWAPAKESGCMASLVAGGADGLPLTPVTE
jgi:hypothetical protein